ncbi:MAG: NACHT domain-containing protein, partial [Gammaproteobacteria bacterium]
MTDSGGLSADRGSAALGLAYESLIQIININHPGIGLGEAEVRKREVLYLKRIMSDCGGLEWLEQVEFSESDLPPLRLESIYTPQYVIEQEHFEHAAKRPEAQREARRLSAVEVLNREARLVLTGAPGSGKSAFVNYVLLCLAGEALNDPRAGLDALTEPVPPDQDHSPDQTSKARQPWDRGVLVPVRVILRDFSASAEFPTEGTTGETRHVLNFLHKKLTVWACESYWPVLEARLQEGKVLLLFDGLDEVPEAGKRRARLIQCIRGIGRSYPDVRILVTCRPYAYRQQPWRLESFADATLAEFGPGQIACFIDRWYGQLLALDPENSEQRRNHFKQAVLERESLRDLVKRPLLLNLTAYLHARRHELPSRRADLYESLLDLLIDKWEKARFEVSNTEEAHRLQQYGLAEFLRIEQKTIHTILKRLAFAAHARQPESAGTADIPGRDLINELTYAAKDAGHHGVDVPELCEYLRDRVGILYQRSEEDGRNAVYTFPHRSFQEYLAAAYFPLEEDELFQCFANDRSNPEFDYWPDLLAHLAQTDPERWREVVLLAAGKQIGVAPRSVWDLLSALVPEEPADCLTDSERLWGLRLAGEILAENLHYTRLTAGQRALSERIRSALPGVLATSLLPAAERVATGRHLAIIGDPRPEITDVDSMRFCRVPAGAFWMGKGAADQEGEELRSETPAGEYNLDYAYWIAENPVTVAQFRAFVSDSQHRPGDEDSLKGNANEPVVRVSWDEAGAFCGWLTKRWRAQGCLPRGWNVTLPNEPEWEKAARGGLRIPVRRLIRSISEIFVTEEGAMENTDDNAFEENPLTQRRYPWGNEIDEEFCNYAMNIGRVSTPGVYPAGKSHYGCQDLGGNVWEWTRS